jgi:uncharacterized protein (TIGR03083 family)
MLRFHDADQGVLIGIWHQACTELRDLAAAERWGRPSVLPGWTVADIVAHTSWIERLALGRSDPPHEPDWAALPHVAGEFSRATEVPVDLRRGWPREAVLAEYDDTIAARHAALLAAPAGAAARNVFGQVRPVSDILRMRIFDIWVHTQDIRVGVGAPGGLASDAAWVAAGRMAGALGYVWAKSVDAPVGSTLVVDCTGPGVRFTAAVGRSDDGRGGPVAVPDDPTVRLTMGFPDYVALSCGRANAEPGRVQVEGDAALAGRTLARFGIAP